MVSNGIFIICVILALMFGATVGLFGASLCIVAKDNKEKLNITDNGKSLVESLRQLGKYSEFEPNYFLLAADRIEELEQGVKHGCWQYDGYGGGVILGTDAPLSYKCSACGEWSVDESNFCPNCGAKMESEGAE